MVGVACGVGGSTIGVNGIGTHRKRRNQRARDESLLAQQRKEFQELSERLDARLDALGGSTAFATGHTVSNGVEAIPRRRNQQAFKKAAQRQREFRQF